MDFDETADKWLLDGIFKYLVFENPTEEDILKDLTVNRRNIHPAMQISTKSLGKIKSLIKDDRYAKMMSQFCVRKADSFLDCAAAKDDGEKRTNLTKLKDLAFAFLLTENEKYLSKVNEIFSDSVSVTDWDHELFLNTSYFDTFGDRYRYYRNMPDGHNTLVFGKPEENCRDIFKRALLKNVKTGDEISEATVDMSEVYGKYVTLCQRKFVFDKQQKKLTVSYAKSFRI